jgi:hypothetical protein
MRAVEPMKRRRANEDASALLIALAISFVMTIVIGGAFLLVSGVTRRANSSQVREQAISIGLGAIDISYAQWRDRCRNKVSVPVTTDDLASLVPPSISAFGSPPGVTLNNVRVVAMNPDETALAGSVLPARGFGPSDNSFSYYYLGSADVTIPYVGGVYTAHVKRALEQGHQSPWAYAIFYDGDLEMHPGPQQFVTGWVHTNSTLYAAHASLTFQSRVTSVRGWLMGFAPADQSHVSDIPASPSYPADIPPAKDINHQPFGMDPWAVFADRYGLPGKLKNDGWRELIQMPPPGGTDPNPTARYYNQADAKVLVDANNKVSILNKAGTAVTASSSGKDLQIYNCFSKAIATNGSLTDNREGSAIRIVSVDMGQITTAVAAGALTWNGILYVADTSNTTSSRRGLKVMNASRSPAGGVSLITPNALYVQGDVNTGGSPPSNTGTFTQPTLSPYVSQPTMFASDAVTILSNAWLDGNSAAGQAALTATNTTVNAALLSGIVPSVAGSYSGGSENFPRFLENWSGVNFTYYGSIVQLWNSAQSIGKWGKSNVYSPPVRHWYFDEALRTNPPPGNLELVNYYKNRWWVE